jgi:ClpP class serine protease
MVALSADEIIMDSNAVLGPVDPQLGEWPAASIVKIPDTKPIAEIDDKTLVLADVGRKALIQVRDSVRKILIANGEESDKADKLAETLSCGKWTHDYPIDATEARSLGLSISEELPREVYDLMSLYREPSEQRPSVQYIPVPYQDRRTHHGRKGS